MSMKKTVTVVSLAILLIGAAQGMAGQNVPAMKDVFKDTFLIGGALNRPLVSGRDPNAAALAIKHFSTATSENDLKWQLVHPQPNQYNWEPADSYVAFGEKNKMFVIGHCLVWHAQTPRWVFQDDAGNPLTRDALLARMKDHIMTVVGHYKGRVKGWDVVNEALDDSGKMRNTQWLRIIGEGSEDKKYDHIENAFRWAHEADPDAELYYNDYNLEVSKAKCDAAVAIVKYLKSKGLRIDGVGIQLHGGLTYPSVAGLEYAITSLAATGVKVMITELDLKTQTRALAALMSVRSTGPAQRIRTPRPLRRRRSSPTSTPRSSPCCSSTRRTSAASRSGASMTRRPGSAARRCCSIGTTNPKRRSSRW